MFGRKNNRRLTLLSDISDIRRKNTNIWNYKTLFRKEKTEYFDFFLKI